MLEDNWAFANPPANNGQAKPTTPSTNITEFLQRSFGAVLTFVQFVFNKVEDGEVLYLLGCVLPL